LPRGQDVDKRGSSAEILVTFDPFKTAANSLPVWP
jgi:hypothetical protein